MIQIQQTKTADFDHPLEMLEACHERIGERLETMRRLLEHLPAHGCDDQACQAAANVLRYFDSAGEHHHDDEERDLFPALAASPASDAAVMDLIARLRRDHNAMRTLWQSLREQFEAIAQARSADLDAECVERFCALYGRHIELEEARLLPLAERVLTVVEQEALGRAMAARRGVRKD